MPDPFRTSGQTTAHKAIAAAIVPILAIAVTYLLTGEMDEQELAVALTGAVSFVLVYLTPNEPKIRGRGGRTDLGG